MIYPLSIKWSENLKNFQLPGGLGSVQTATLEVPNTARKWRCTRFFISSTFINNIRLKIPMKMIFSICRSLQVYILILSTVSTDSTSSTVSNLYGNVLGLYFLYVWVYKSINWFFPLFPLIPPVPRFRICMEMF